MKSRLLILIFLFIAVTSGLTAFVTQAKELSGRSDTVVSTTNNTTIEQIGGSVRTVAITGTTMFAGRGPRLLAYDIQTPSQPVEIGKTAVLTQEVSDIDISGNYLYAILGGDIGVFDISNPTTPSLAYHLPITYTAEAIKINGNYAYVVGSGNGAESGLYVYDISTPTSPTQVDHLAFDQGSYFNIAISGNYAYISMDTGSPNYTAGFFIVNITDPLNVQQVGGAPLGDNIQNQAGITIDNGYLYAAGRNAGQDGLTIFSLANPEAPAFQSFYPGPFLARSIAISGDYAFVAGSSGGLRTFNISDPTMPTDAGVYNLNALLSAVDVTISGSTAYLAYYGLGLRAIDISTPTTLTVTKTINPLGYATGIAYQNNAIFVIDYEEGLRILDKSNYSELGFYPTGNNLGKLTVTNDTLFARSTNPHGLQIFNVSNLAVPTATSFYTTTEYLKNYTISGNYAYLAVGSDGLEIVDISNLSNPTQAGTFTDTISPLGGVSDVDVANNFAYLADRDNGLRIINVSNPATPTQVGSINTTGWADFVQVKGQYAYVITGNKTLQIIDISDPTLPVSVSSQDVSTTASVETLSLTGDNLYIGLGSVDICVRFTSI